MQEIILELEIENINSSGVIFSGMEKTFKIIEKNFDVIISTRGNRLFIKGPEDQAHKAESLIQEITDIRSNGFYLKPEDINFAIRSISKGEETSLRNLFLNRIPVSSKKKFIVPKTETQRRYVEAISKYDIVFGIGPAGTGKTYLAMAKAVSALAKKEVSRIVLARPAVEAGEKLGFLPGNLYEKVHPYLRPLYDALYDMMDFEKATRLIERGIIEIAPLAYMRGRTLNDSFIILDEAQNTTSEQMKMYLTRLGFNSKTVITGDITQIDLPQGRTSGLIEAQRLLSRIKGIKIINFSERDVVRHRLVQEIIRAYEEFEKRSDKRDTE
jgi:phosphate starvation-inducible PhoH-like protein